MILKKIMTDEGISYIEINLEEAIKLDRQDLVFTDSSEDEYDDYIDAMEENDSDVDCEISFENIKSKKAQRMLALLPFLDDEELKALVQDILNGKEDCKDIPLVAVMPFLGREDCDALFMKFATIGDNKMLIHIVPFVSKECLSDLVSAYIDGKNTNVDFNLLYPFLDAIDIKRLFKFEMGR